MSRLLDNFLRVAIVVWCIFAVAAGLRAEALSGPPAHYYSDGVTYDLVSYTANGDGTYTCDYHPETGGGPDAIIIWGT